MISNSQYNAIMRIYDRLQSDNRYEREQRRLEVYGRIPRMRELDTAAGASALRRLQAVTGGEDTAPLADFKEELEALKKEKEALLLENGFPADYMELRYVCRDCEDTGWCGETRCHCFQKKVLSLLYKESNLESLEGVEDFSGFRFHYFDDERVITAVGMTAMEYMKKVFRQCQDYVKQFPDTGENLIFMGNTGVGKTFLSKCIGKELLKRCHSVLYITAEDLFSQLSKAKLSREEEPGARRLEEFVRDCDLLIVDDLGTETANSWTNSQFFHLMNGRINQKKGMIVSTNLSMSMMRDRYSERVTSRLFSHYTIIPLYGDDIRLKE